MRRGKKQGALGAVLAVCLALTLALSGCELLPSDDYVDYDVSAYIQTFQPRVPALSWAGL